MDEEMYPMMGSETDQAEKPESDQDDSSQTALIPKSLLAGKTFNPGDELVLKIEHVYEDEVEVSYAKGEDKSKPESAPPTADEEIDAYENA